MLRSKVIRRKEIQSAITLWFRLIHGFITFYLPRCWLFWYCKFQYDIKYFQYAQSKHELCTWWTYNKDSRARTPFYVSGISFISANSKLVMTRVHIIFWNDLRFVCFIINPSIISATQNYNKKLTGILF